MTEFVVASGGRVVRGHRLVAVVVAATALAVAGCGGSDDDGKVVLTAAQRVEAAASATVELGTARVEMTVDVESPDPDLAGSSFSGAGVMVLDNSVAELDVEIPGVGFSFTTRMFDGVAYYRYPPELMAQLGTDAGWVRLDTADLAGAAGFDEQTLQQFQQQDPTQMLRYLAAVGGDVEAIGTEEVRGVETTHYRASLDTRRHDFDEATLDELGIDAGGLREYLTVLSETYGFESLPTNVWLDADGAVRRFEMKLDLAGILAAQGLGGEGTMVMAMDFFEFGVEVDVEEPAPGDVVDFADLPGLVPSAPA